LRALELDERLLRAARTRAHGEACERAVAAFSRLGEHGAVWLALGLAGQWLDPSRRRGWRAGAAAVAGAYALNSALKLLVRRRRPRLRGLAPLARTPTRLSFPSAHAAHSMLYPWLALTLVIRLRPGIAGGTALLVTGFVIAALVGLTRIYLRVHYMSDVTSGWALGAAAFCLCAAVAMLVTHLRNNSARASPAG